MKPSIKFSVFRSIFNDVSDDYDVGLERQELSEGRWPMIAWIIERRRKIVSANLHKIRFCVHNGSVKAKQFFF